MENFLTINLRRDKFQVLNLEVAMKLFVSSLLGCWLFVVSWVSWGATWERVSFSAGYTSR